MIVKAGFDTARTGFLIKTVVTYRVSYLCQLEWTKVSIPAAFISPGVYSAVRGHPFVPLKENVARVGTPHANPPVWIENRMAKGKSNDKLYSKDDKNGEQGFTLIELLVTFSIILFLVLGTIQIVLHSLYVKQSSDYSTCSADLAVSKMEYLKTLPFETGELDEGFGQESLQGESQKGVFVRKWNIRNISGDMKRIEMECFSEQCPRKKTRIVLFYSRILGF